jgi:RNA polymerase primary sigma factor
MMLCQKCGLQEATVHLGTLAFRQRIEEHLCALCAGVRAARAADAVETVPDPAPANPISLPGLRPEAVVRSAIREKVHELVHLSKRQGYLTFDDLHRALPDPVETPEEIMGILSLLRELEIEIVPG